MKSRILTLGKHVLLSALFCYIAFIFAESLSRTSRLFPARSDASSPAPLGSLALATSHQLQGGGIAYLFPGAAKAQPLPSLLIAPGGDESPLAWADLARDTAWLGHDVLLVHYPGFQGAPGKLATPSLHQALIAAATLLREQAPGRPLVGFGRDIGAAALAHIATDLDLDGLVLLSTYRSTRDLMPTRLTPPGFGPWRFDNRTALAAIEIPTLIFHGRDDPIVPMDLALDLAQLGPHIDFYRIGVARELTPYHWNYVKERILRLLRSLTYPPLPPAPTSPHASPPCP
jgi:uncharacterized protein